MRRICQVILWMMVGASMNVIVVSCVYLFGRDIGGRAVIEPMDLTWPTAVQVDWEPPRYSEEWASLTASGGTMSGRRPWFRIEGVGPIFGDRSVSYLTLGWPLRTVQGYWVSEGRTVRLVGYVRVPPGSPRVVPMAPVWSGVVINSLFFAAVSWLAAVGVLSGRRRLRRWRGVCGSCCYDLAGLDGPCPECGASS